ncbi:hypothetical protein J3458_008899 [Metarhizium acridum]|uniref:uncharacterized protein n=1 Tax=Metarhizium acridum TaxID=92637 RepID=UPI001C6B4F18|nr:hypothetical protein J3458_008899 [Metarhizium acridum]
MTALTGLTWSELFRGFTTPVTLGGCFCRPSNRGIQIKETKCLQGYYRDARRHSRLMNSEPSLKYLQERSTRKNSHPSSLGTLSNLPVVSSSRHLKDFAEPKSGRAAPAPIYSSQMFRQ